MLVFTCALFIVNFFIFNAPVSSKVLPFPYVKKTNIIPHYTTNFYFSNSGEYFYDSLLGLGAVIYRTTQPSVKIAVIESPPAQPVGGRIDFVPFGSFGWSPSDETLAGWFSGNRCAYSVWEIELWVYKPKNKTSQLFCVPTTEKRFMWTPFSDSIIFTDKYAGSEILGFNLETRKIQPILMDRRIANNVHELKHELDYLIGSEIYLWDRTKKEIKGWIGREMTEFNDASPQLYLCSSYVRDVNINEQYCMKLLDSTNFKFYTLGKFQLTMAANIVFWVGREKSPLRGFVIFATDIASAQTQEIFRSESMGKDYDFSSTQIDIPMSGNLIALEVQEIVTPQTGTTRSKIIVLELEWPNRLPPPNIILPTRTPAPTPTLAGPFG
jgi:hypothetical protein